MKTLACCCVVCLVTFVATTVYRDYLEVENRLVRRAKQDIEKVISDGQEEIKLQRNPRAKILDALWAVESDRRLDPPDGDGGRSIGPFQIGKLYWEDAVIQSPELLLRGYAACREFSYSKRIIEAYMLRYVPNAWSSNDAEVIARTHNGGPRGQHKKSTLPYWKKVQRVLEAPLSDVSQ